MKRRTNFIKFIQFWGIIFLIGDWCKHYLALTLSVPIVISISAPIKMRGDYFDRQKQIIKQEVERVVDLISYEKAQSEVLTKEKIKSRVHEAYAIAQNIYQQNKTAKSTAEIEQIILDALRPIRFEHGKGYFFATALGWR